MKTIFTNYILSSPGRFLLCVSLAIGCFAISQIAQAVSPSPDGGYPGGNTAEGQAALLSLTTGGYNTAVGYLSLRSNTTNSFNTAIGAGALFANTADQNTATGAGALFSNTTGASNTANGAFALFNNTTGFQNTANGDGALFSNTTGFNNTAIGFNALGPKNTTGTNNIGLGHDSGSLNTGDSNIDIGNLGGGGNEAYTIRIGDVQSATFIVGIRDVTTGQPDAIPVLIDSAGQLGTTSSSRRFKKEIKPMDNASEAILALKPVTFHYKSDKTNRPEFGLIAEEVAAVNPDLVVRDKNGEIYTVRYDAVNAMLLNEFLKARRQIDAQQKQIEALTAVLQKVSAQVEMNRTAPQMVVNEP